MKFELPCEIVKDLLPIYIDGLAGASTEESVKTHLEGCEKCRKLHADMKNEVENADVTEKAVDDKKLYRKIKKKLHKKLWIAIGAGVAAVLLVIGAEKILYEAYIKNIPCEDMNISVTIDTLEEYREKNTGADSVFETMADAGMYRDNMGFQVSRIEDVEQLTMVEIKSPYIIEEVVFWDVDKVASDGILYIDCAKTTILKNKLPQGDDTRTITCFGELEQIIYLDGEKEVLLWENEK